MSAPCVIPEVPVSREDVTLDWLRSVFSPAYQVKSFQWKGEASNGHGAMSTLERISLELESGETLNIILKTLPPEGSIFRNVTVLHCFTQRELQMYTELFPVWDEFLESRNVPSNFRYRRPKCYYAASNNKSQEIPSNPESYQQILILEDLIASGFEMWPEGYGKSLSWDEAKPCIRLIALFHAVSLAYEKVNMGDGNNYYGMVPHLDHRSTNSKDMMEMFFTTGFDAIRKLMREYADKAADEIGSKIPSSVLPLHPMPTGLADHLEVLRENAYENLQFLTPNKDQLGIVAHNDLHVNNFMFLSDKHKKFNSDEHAVVFFDFQASMYSMPTKDLSFFLIQNCEESMLTTELEKTLQYYHEELQAAMGAMGVPLEEYTLDQVRTEYLSMAYLSMLHIIAGGGVLFNDTAADDSKRRFYNRLVKMYTNGQLNFVVFPKKEDSKN